MRNLQSKPRLRALALTAVAAALAWGGLRAAHANDDDGHGKHDEGADHERYTIALWGDMPYNALGKAQYPALLADVNAHHVAFSAFDGDLKAGGDGACSDENVYTPALGYFASLERPMIWVPGDNDWTDCWGRYGPGTGGFDPLERLDHERALFASTPFSLGQEKIRLTRQSSEGGAYAKFVENVRWRRGSVVYIGANVQGSNDNYPYFGVDGETRSDAEIARMRAEETERKAAVIQWLKEGFAYAKKGGAKGVMVIWQADPNFNNEYHLPDPRSYDAFADYIAALRAETIAFAGQVVLVHGDSHYYKMDKPLNADSGGVLANFTRVETFGSRNDHWVSATIDPSNPNVFTFEPRIVPANANQ
jgi:hypothetical protein